MTLVARRSLFESCATPKGWSSVASMEPSEQKALDLVVLRLQRKFPDLPSGSIRDEVDRAYRDYDRSRVRTYLPILVEREVAERFDRHMVAS